MAQLVRVVPEVAEDHVEPRLQAAVAFVGRPAILPRKLLGDIREVCSKWHQPGVAVGVEELTAQAVKSTDHSGIEVASCPAL